MKGLIHFYRSVNILSVDIALGAIAGALFFAQILDVDILPYGIVGLGLTVWIIYTVDHLRDARQMPRPASSQRHRFHQEHFGTLVVMTTLAILLDGVIVYFMRANVRLGGVALAALVVLYLLMQRRLRGVKEFFIAALYTCGVLLPSVAVTTEKLDVFHYLIIVHFALIALFNLILFSWIDHDHDSRDGQISMSTVWGRSHAERVMWTIGAVNVMIEVCLFLSYSRPVVVTVLALMNVVLFAIFLFTRRYATTGLSRLLGDAVFYLPAFYWLWDHL